MKLDAHKASEVLAIETMLCHLSRDPDVPTYPDEFWRAFNASTTAVLSDKADEIAEALGIKLNEYYAENYQQWLEESDGK